MIDVSSKDQICFVSVQKQDYTSLQEDACVQFNTHNSKLVLSQQPNLKGQIVSMLSKPGVSFTNTDLLVIMSNKALLRVI